MILAEFLCPKCGHIELAPLNGVVRGDAGIWCCAKCNQAFRITIDFQAVTDEQISRAFADRKDDDMRPRDDHQR